MTADSAYTSSTRRNYQPHPPRSNSIHHRTMDGIIAVASAGFRLSLVLNAVGTGMANPDCDIHTVAKHISLFSLMLKNTHEAIRHGRATQAAVDVVSEISHQGQLVFDEIKSMTDLSQGRDEKGVLRSITIAERGKWTFKKHKVQYLVGQLDSLKLSLAVVLQVLQMGKGLANPHQDPYSRALTDGKAMVQEQAEVQNMIVVQHWSLVELRRLYQLAESEAREEAINGSHDDPPPRYEDHRAIEPNYYSQKATEGDLQLAIVPPPEDNSRAMVKYQEKPVQQLDAAFTKALVPENRALGANVNNVVDHLLHEWTQIPELDSHPVSRYRRPSLSTYNESDEEDTTESEYDEVRTKGRYIEGSKKVKKDVRFKANVESDEDEDDHRPRHRRPPRKHILHSESDTSSDSDSAPPIQHRAQPPSRRGSEASNGRYDPQDRNPRPYASNGVNHQRENPTLPGSRPTSSRGIPQPPIGPNYNRPMPNPNPNPNPTPYQTTSPMPIPPTLHPPSYHGPHPGASPRNQYVPPGYPGQSPQPPHGNYFPPAIQQQRPPLQQQHRSSKHSHRHHHPQKTEQQKAEEDKHAANKNLKRGLFGGAAIAGILDMLQGLDGI